MCGRSSLSHPHPELSETIRLVFDEASPIRDAVLEVNWLKVTVDSIESLIAQAKLNADRNGSSEPVRIFGIDLRN